MPLDSSPATRRKSDARRVLLAVVLALVSLALAGCGGSHPRTEVLRATNPVLADIYVRITGPGGAVSYVAHRFRSGGAFDRFSFHEADNHGLFLPPRVRERKLCASTHEIRLGDALQLQKWRGRTLAITIYGRKSSRIYCSVLGYGLYLPSS
ncbi:MAG TPA: hypothetical protein VJ716_04610 [Gaiellaceae bacterium]|nr:hypothetical protein [Gaiellaceae bacterium]